MPNASRASDVSVPSAPHLERPRERIVADGARALSDADLLALVLGTGSGRLSARGMLLRAITVSSATGRQ